MELGKEDEIVEAQLAAATRAQVALARERLRKLWMGLNDTESLIRRGQVAYLESRTPEPRRALDRAAEMINAGLCWPANLCTTTRYVGTTTERLSRKR